MSSDREAVVAARRWVVKLGSALVTRDGAGINHAELRIWVDQMATLRERGIELVVVSSGSIAEGMSRMGLQRRPVELHEQQALAAIGQMGLVQAYEVCFKAHGMQTAQVLLTHDDITNRKRYLNARSTLRTLVRYGVVPIVNENDTVATSEIRVGDNDTLGGMAANLVEAQLLVLLTDQSGLYTADPRQDPTARLVGNARAGDPEIEKMAGEGGALGRGGMRTKLRAARQAARSGAATVIAGGRDPNVLLRIADGEPVGTLLQPGHLPLAARKRWLAGHPGVRGTLVLDDGAVSVLRRSGRSLLAVGVCDVHGEFARGEIVRCVDLRQVEVARGLVNYGADETRRIMGQPSERIASLLGYVDEPELIHRDNLVLMED